MSILDKQLLNDYGITWQEYQDKFDTQKGVCWICGFPPKVRKLNVDHRHVKGYKKLPPEKKKLEVRGLLCYSCNYMIGFIEKNIEGRKILNKVNEYFNVYKCKGDL